MITSADLFRIARITPPDATDGHLLRRFAESHDEAAFTEIVHRNGPYVLRVCRSILGEASAEDAFQATFPHLLRGPADCPIVDSDVELHPTPGP